MPGQPARRGWIRLIATWAASAIVLLASNATADDGEELTIEEVLTRWAEASVTEGPFETWFQCYQYDSEFGTETRQRVALRRDGEGLLEYRTDPMPVEEGAVNSDKLTAEGVPYSIVSGTSASWICTPEFVVVADHSNRTVATLKRLEAPEGWFALNLWEDISTLPPPITLNMPVDADELQRDYHWEFAELMGHGIHIRGVPRDERLARQVASIDLILDETTWLPLAYRHRNGDHELVLVVSMRLDPRIIGCHRIDVSRTIEDVAKYQLIERDGASTANVLGVPEPVLLQEKASRSADYFMRLLLRPLPTLLESVIDAYDTPNLQMRLDRLITNPKSCRKNASLPPSSTSGKSLSSASPARLCSKSCATSSA